MGAALPYLRRLILPFEGEIEVIEADVVLSERLTRRDAWKPPVGAVVEEGPPEKGLTNFGLSGKLEPLFTIPRAVRSAEGGPASFLSPVACES